MEREHGAITYLRIEFAMLDKLVLSLADRVEKQSELLIKRAEHARRESPNSGREETHEPAAEDVLHGMPVGPYR